MIRTDLLHWRSNLLKNINSKQYAALFSCVTGEQIMAVLVAFHNLDRHRYEENVDVNDEKIG